MELVKLLKDLGLNTYEAKAYLALLENGPLPPSKISSITGIPRPRIYDVLESLRKKHFCTLEPRRPLIYGAVNPDSLLSILKKKVEEEMQERIRRIEKTISALKSKVKTKKKGKEGKVMIISHALAEDRIRELVEKGEGIFVDIGLGEDQKIFLGQDQAFIFLNDHDVLWIHHPELVASLKNKF